MTFKVSSNPNLSMSMLLYDYSRYWLSKYFMTQTLSNYSMRSLPRTGGYSIKHKFSIRQKSFKALDLNSALKIYLTEVWTLLAWFIHAIAKLLSQTNPPLIPHCLALSSSYHCELRRCMQSWTALGPMRVPDKGKTLSVFPDHVCLAYWRTDSQCYQT